MRQLDRQLGRRTLAVQGRVPVKTVAETLAVSHSNLNVHASLSEQAFESGQHTPARFRATSPPSGLDRSAFRAARGLGRLKQWTATFVANVVSTYALDTVCTASGVVLVATGLLSGLEVGGATTILALSYVLWAGGLSRSLDANWQLLEATGTSTSILSKLAFDLSGDRARRFGLRRGLTAAGYVVFELAKESPYYIGAFGLAAASGAVSNVDAIVFLAGANVGAAAYEFGLGWSTRVLLEKRERPEYASFKKEWSASDYLAEYYGAVEADERETIAFFTDAARQMPLGEPALVFGVGPTLHHVFLLARHTSEIHLGDYLRGNLDEIARWMRKDRHAHDWQPFVTETLRWEGVVRPHPVEVLAREQLTRSATTALLEVDVRRDRPLGGAHRLYGTVLSAYCVDSMTESLADWQRCMRRVVGMVRPGGTLLVAALGDTRSYLVGGKAFPSPGLRAADMETLLREYFCESDTAIRTVQVPGCASHGYSQIILAAAHSRRAVGRQRM
jgi:hypothetical protein